MIIYVILFGLIALGLMFFISHLWDRVDKLQRQVHQQDYDIGYNKIAINQLVEDVHKERGNEIKKSNFSTYRI